MTTAENAYEAHAYEPDWYDRLKRIADRIDRHAQESRLGSEPTILEETAAEDEPELAGRT